MGFMDVYFLNFICRAPSRMALCEGSKVVLQSLARHALFGNGFEQVVGFSAPGDWGVV